jgi:hypothetical protein
LIRLFDDKNKFKTLVLIPFVMALSLDLNASAKVSECVQIVKKNMKLFQKSIEIYANENQGQFPDNMITISIEGNKKVRKDLDSMKNPMKTKYAHFFVVFDYLDYFVDTKYQKQKCDFAGLVLYEPTEVIGNQKILPSRYTYGKYRIYGTDECGELIKENGKIFIIERKKFHPKSDLKTYKMFNPNKKIEKGNN